MVERDAHSGAPIGGQMPHKGSLAGFIIVGTTAEKLGQASI
jgi:hypothetical protein